MKRYRAWTCRGWWVALVGLVVMTGAGRAEVHEQSFTVGIDVPDDSSTGLLNVQSLSVSGRIVSGIVVGLSIDRAAGDVAFLGDLYAYLEHGGARAVLLNRPGRRTGLSSGFGDDQPLSVTFQDGARDIHEYRDNILLPLTSALTGIWGPDGRTTDPALVLTTDLRTAALGGFVGLSVDGEWNLFVSDLSGGARHRLVDWSLRLDLAPIPEPEVTTFALLLLLGSVARRAGRAAI